MISLVLALSLSRIAAEPAASMSFFEPAAPLWRLMPRLAVACESPLQVAPSMENQVLCISVHDVSKKELLDRIATATGGHWRDIGASVLLEPDAKLRAAIEERALVKRAARIQEDIDRLAPMTDAELTKRWPDKVEEVAMHCQQRLLHHIVESIGARAIAAMPLASRVVYSTSPTSVQRQLPAECNSDVIADDAAWEIADAKHRDDARVEREQSALADPHFRASDEPPLPRKRQKLNVILTRCFRPGLGCGQGQVQLCLEWYDDRGSQTGDCYCVPPLTVDSGFDDSGREIDPNANGLLLVGAVDPKSLPQGEEEIELSRPAIQLMNVFSTDGATADRFSVSDEKSVLCSPDKADPLSYPAEWIVGAARARHLQVVASLPDTIFAWCNREYWEFRGRQKITPEVVFEDLPKLANSSVAVDSGWFTVSPNDFDQTPVDRRLLASLMEKDYGKNDLTLGDFLEVARAGFSEDKGSVLPCWLETACPILYDIPEDWGWLRILSGIPSNQLDSMAQGGVQLSDLGPTKAAEIERYLFNFGYSWGLGLQVDASLPEQQKTPHLQDVDESSGGFVPDD